jgi:5-methylcytosine-specific restriction endonuclease McrA
MSGNVLVLNAGYEPLHRVSIKHAIRMLVREVAVVEEADEEKTYGPFPMPKVLRLVRYVAQKWKYATTPRWSKSRVLKRDHYTCAYCGGHATTNDHVLPQSRGGKTTWLNSVSACSPCNNKKDNRTPEEAHMPLRYQPYEPTWLELQK